MMRRIVAFTVALPVMAGTLVWAADPPMSETRTRTEMKDRNADHMMTSRVSKTIGMDIYNNESKKIADVKDIVLDGSLNHVDYVVVSYGGLMGMGDKLFAVPWNALQHRTVDPKKLYMNITEDQLKNAPGFDKNSWPDMADATFRESVSTYYRPQSEWRAAQDKRDQNMDRREAKMEGKEKKGLVWCRRANDVIGADVSNTANENVGDIKDLVVDEQSGDVQYAVLSFGGILGVGDKLFAIPASSLRTDPDKKRFVLDVPKDRLKAAPGFDKDNWPDFADAQFRSSIHEYYRSAPGERAKTE